MVFRRNSFIMMAFLAFNCLDSFKTYCIFTDWSPWLQGEGTGRWGYLGAWEFPTCTHTWTHMHIHTCMCVHPKIYMYRKCKWPPSWVSSLACLTCVYVPVCMRHPHTPTIPFTHHPSQGIPKSVKMQ